MSGNPPLPCLALPECVPLSPRVLCKHLDTPFVTRATATRSGGTMVTVTWTQSRVIVFFSHTDLPHTYIEKSLLVLIKFSGVSRSPTSQPQTGLWQGLHKNTLLSPLADTQKDKLPHSYPQKIAQSSKASCLHHHR